jgi:hypothetical protein
VRGSVAQRAGELKKMLAEGQSLPFDSLILCNIGQLGVRGAAERGRFPGAVTGRVSLPAGNPHAVKQTPITYYRQVAAALYVPELGTAPQKLIDSGLFPADVVARATTYLKATGYACLGSEALWTKLSGEKSHRFHPSSISSVFGLTGVAAESFLTLACAESFLTLAC